jgi:DNA-binding GntR family transcriptional regulator
MALMRSHLRPAGPLDTLFAKSTNLGEQVYEHLREQILSRQFPGGVELPEGRLAEHLQVSRTPMREALVRLVGEGLLERSAERAYRVRAVSTREYFECMQLREILECYAIDQAITTVTDEDLGSLRRELRALGDSVEDDMPHWRFENRFHSFFALKAGDATLADTITRMRVIARLFRISSRYHRKREFDSEHLAIIEAIERRDSLAAKAAMRSHLRNLQDAVRQAVAAEMHPGA